MSNITAMLLAAGFGRRMRPLTETCPKPLLKLAGRSLIDRVLDSLVLAGICRVIINIHYLADQLESHLRGRTDLEIIISDERESLLDTGGAVIAARSMFGDDPVIIANTDSVWEDSGAAFKSLIERFDPVEMDFLLLLADRQRSLGYRGAGDFFRQEDGRLRRRGEAKSAPFINAGAYILHPSILSGRAIEPVSANILWDEALARERLYGHILPAFWMHVGDVAALREAEHKMSRGASA